MPAVGAVHVMFVSEQSRSPRQLTPSSGHAPPAPTFTWQVPPAHVESWRHSLEYMQAAPAASAGTHFIIASSQCSRKSAHGNRTFGSHVPPEAAGWMHVGLFAKMSQIIVPAHASSESHAAPAIVMYAVQVPPVCDVYLQ